MKYRRFFLIPIFYIFLTNISLAHELRPAYLELRQKNLEDYEILWKVPAQEELRLGLSVQLPLRCKNSSSLRRYSTGTGWVDRWSIHCDQGLKGEQIGVDGLATTLTDVLVRIERENGTSQTARLDAATPFFMVQESPSGWGVVTTYLRLGIEHILSGIDHLLFVLGLLILVQGWRRLLVTITAFTLAHSLTLAAATLGWVHIPGPPVEASIALSIVFIAVEILKSRKGKGGLAAQYPWVIAFAFGLLHGFGFAGALAEVGLPPQAIPLALLFFNLGVELGQLAFIASVYLLIALFKRWRFPKPAWTTTAAAYLIGSVASFWLILRVADFF